jgi:hypothetical protein
MKELNLKIIQYDNCHDCQFLELPNEKGEIPIPGSILILSKTVLSKDGSFIPNPIQGRCGVDGKRLLSLSGCQRWFNGTKIINY